MFRDPGPNLRGRQEQTDAPALNKHNGSNVNGLDLLLLANLLDGSRDLARHGLDEDALSLYASVISYYKDCSWTNAQLVFHQLQKATRKLQDAQDKTSMPLTMEQPELPDMYHEDECDVGPRPFRRPVFPDSTLFTDSSSSSVELVAAFCEMVMIYNRGVVQHAISEYGETMRLYEVVALALSKLLPQACPRLRQHLLELSMRVQNNMGHITYMLGLEDSAAQHFRAALCCCEHVKASVQGSLRLEYAAVVSNWCRVHWMSGDINDQVHQGLEEVLRIRSEVLEWDHMDVASSHYNLGMAEYARNRSEAALVHLFSYLRVAASKAKKTKEEWLQQQPMPRDAKLYALDPMPALVYILLVKNEPKEDEMAQELVRGLRTLQEKRSCVGPQGPEVASVLNFIGTILFHQRDNEHALLFFQEELRLEENLVFLQDDVSISVTCNNIGRILQELNRLPEAKHYYHRALKGHYGDAIEEWCALPKALDACPPQWNMEHLSDLPRSTMQLYSAVWYNLGLIHDKLGGFREATNAFQVSLGLRRALLGPNHADVACLLYNIGVLQMEQKLLVEATASFQDALKIRQTSPSMGHLNDAHVVQTLKKLATLHKSNGDIEGALKTLFEVANLQNTPATTTLPTTLSVTADSGPLDQVIPKNNKELGVTYREIAELYHSQGNISMAITMSQKSTDLLREIQLAAAGTQEFVVYTEEMVAGLLLRGSLFHEVCDAMMARQFFEEASSMIARVSSYFPTSKALDAMQEVTMILAACHCAPVA